MSNVQALCPDCGESLDIFTDKVICSSCGVNYPSPFGVPILISGAVVEKHNNVNQKSIQSIIEALGAEKFKKDIEECFSLYIKMPSSSIQVEADQFLQRLISGGSNIDVTNENRGHSLSQMNILEDIDIVINALILPNHFPAGQSISINIKIENIGTCPLSSDHNNPIHISYQWRKKRSKSIFNLFSKPVPLHFKNELRTKLLVNIPAGQKLTQAIRVVCPETPGDYILEILPVLEQVAWLHNHSISYQVSVIDEPLPTDYSQNLNGTPLTYSQQHINAFTLFMKWVREKLQNDKPLVMEIGGNYHPSTQGLPLGQVINLDVDAHGLMARNIIKADSIKSIVADGMDIPFADGTFDAIVMFATFHHFWDPILFLKNLSKKIKPSGMICLMCEPIGHVFAEHNYKEFIGELERGVNEQSFEIWEYQKMIDEAGLEIVDALFDRGSAMIALRSK